MNEKPHRTMFYLAQELLALRKPGPKQKGFNPRPPGVIRDGSATRAVMAELVHCYPAWRTQSQLCWTLKRERGAVQWALRYLQQLELIQSVPDAVRNPRYRRYRAIPQEGNK
jgi:hypothetical protein